MYKTCIRFYRYLLLLSLPFLLVPTVLTVLAVSTSLVVLTVSSLVLVIGVEVVKSDTGFLTSRDTLWYNISSGNNYST